MTIQIERISHRAIQNLGRRCCVPECAETAIWLLTDRDMPTTHAVNMGQRPCCTAHIATTYVSLRGAHLIAWAAAGYPHREPVEADQPALREPHAVGALASEG